MDTENWQVRPRQAQRRQKELAQAMRLAPLLGWDTVAAVAYAFAKRGSQCRAAACVADHEGEVLLEASASARAPRPYARGLLIYSAGPAIEAALARVDRRVDLLLCLGHGLAHPRRCGLATHLGLLYDLPSVGCASGALIGEYDAPGNRAGDWAPLVHRGDTLGAVLRTQSDTYPLFTSPGHRVDVPGCVQVIMSLTGNYRWPEPLRQARHLARQLRAEHDEGAQACR